MTKALLDDLDVLEAYYRKKRGVEGFCENEFQKSYEFYGDRSEASLIDAAAAAAALDVSAIREHVDPRVVEAFHLQCPNMNIHDIGAYSNERLQGLVNSVKGKLFEILIRDKLNSGEWIGDIHLSIGDCATLAENATQPGWDLQILNAHGQVIEYLQAKATGSLSYIKEALEKYPDIRVITTLPGVDTILHNATDIGVHDGTLEAMSHDGLSNMSHSVTQQFLHHINPLIPIVIIAMTEGWSVIAGRSNLEFSAKRGLNRLSKSMCCMSSGALLLLINAPGLLCTVGSMSTRFGIDAALNRMRLSDVLDNYIYLLDEELCNRPQ